MYTDPAVSCYVLACFEERRVNVLDGLPVASKFDVRLNWMLAYKLKSLGTLAAAKDVVYAFDIENEPFVAYHDG
jgi:hypothetical protein